MSKQEKLKEKLKKLDHDALQRFADRTCSKKGIGRNELWEKVPPLAEVLHEKGLLEKPGVDEGEDDLDALIDLEGDETASVDEPVLERPMSADEESDIERRADEHEEEPEDTQHADDLEHEEDDVEEQEILDEEEEELFDITISELFEEFHPISKFLIKALAHIGFVGLGVTGGMGTSHLIWHGSESPQDLYMLIMTIASSVSFLAVMTLVFVSGMETVNILRKIQKETDEED